ncbi:2'-5' RNA ligase family protein [Pseudalkalibacillus caeni]|uniref:2'-5' RNA ligase family protein n=1 Tax=Exobacillus caeni TaxID=2574798 RepID=A0A5R9F9P3_9BACL|nr:2'-5' RNA ligase family protein [Pseudalkalibacillus caeni]TLS36425.1 2'-5' RNA ligase family protein [Pseudalkalibacillus caeni]
MYAVVGFLDRQSEQRIRNVWNELSDQGITSYFKETDYMRPHLTIADYENINKTEFTSLLRRFYSEKAKIPLSINGLGSFLNTGTLFVSPTFTNTLRAFHTGHHEAFRQFHDDPGSLYVPDKWIPHCTIASRLNQQQLKEAFSYCSNNLSATTAQISEIALLELVYKNGRCVSAPAVCSVVLH